MVDKKESGNSVQPTSRIVLLSTLAQRLRLWGVETRGIQPIPETERTDTRYNRIFFIWLRSNFNILRFSCLSNFSHTLIPQSKPLVSALAPFLLPTDLGLRTHAFFNMFFTLFPAYLGILGPKLGFRQMVHGRYSFGYFGVILPCLLNMMTALGYAVLACIVGGQALSAAGDGSIGLTVGIVVVGIASLALTFCGYKVLSWFDRLPWIPVFIVCLVMTGVGAKHLRISDAPAPALASVFNYGALVGAGVSWAAVSSDFTSHFHPSALSRRLFLYAYLGTTIPTTSMSILGAAFGAGVANVPSWQEECWRLHCCDPQTHRKLRKIPHSLTRSWGDSQYCDELLLLLRKRRSISANPAQYTEIYILPSRCRHCHTRRNRRIQVFL